MNLKKIILIFALIFFTAASVEAEENEMPFDPVATTYSEGDTAALELVKMKADGELYFEIMDIKRRAVGFVSYSRKVYDFYLNRGDTGYPPLIFELVLPARQRVQIDDYLGEWQGNLHVIPVYALFDVTDGRIVCDKPFYSAHGLNPSHYHGTVKNSEHTRLIEILMTLMPRLHERVQSQGLTLP